MVRIALLFFALLVCGCQKNTFELANAEEPETAPSYTVEPLLQPVDKQ